MEVKLSDYEMSNYSDYLMESLDRTIKYTEYLASEINNNYFRIIDDKCVSRIEKINKIFYETK